MPCNIYSEIQVGETYSIESSDGSKTGQILITSLDQVTCDIGFRIVNGSDWININFEEDFDIKLLLPDDTFCLLNPFPEPVWVNALWYNDPNTAVWEADSSYFAWNGECWELSQSELTGSPSTARTIDLSSPALAEVTEEGNITGIRFTVSTAGYDGTFHNIVARFTVDGSTFYEETLNFSSTESQQVTFTFSNPPAFDPSTTQILIHRDDSTSFENYGETFICDIELLVNPEIVSIFGTNPLVPVPIPVG